jgi:flavin-dependent dehydrogenase
VTREVDVLVIGGGPAGSTAAGLLAAWGRSVVLVHRASGRPDLAESLPASTRKPLRFLGQLEAVDAGRFHPNRGNVSCWAGTAAIVTSDDSGYHVLRGEFDRRLRDHASARGAFIVDGHVRSVDGRGPLSVHVSEDGGKRSEVIAEFVLDCSGRAGVVAGRGLRRLDAGYRTLAVAGEWTSGSWPDGEHAHTIVESYADGWAWSVPLSVARRQCTVMVNWERRLVGRAGLRALYRSELARTAALRDRLERATPIGEPWVCDATLYRSARAADERVLLVGDAASFIEPLSAAGVKKALTSAWRAAVVVNSAFRSSAMKAPAFELFDRREQHVYQDCARRAAAFFQDAADAHRSEFWAARAALARSAAAGRSDDTIERDPTADPAVRRAFDRLRARTGLRLTVARDARLAPTAVIEGNEVVLRDGIVIPGLESPVRFAAGVNLPELMQAAPCGDLTAVRHAYQARMGQVDPRELLAGVSVLVANGMLEIHPPRA